MNRSREPQQVRRTGEPAQPELGRRRSAKPPVQRFHPQAAPSGLSFLDAEIRKFASSGAFELVRDCLPPSIRSASLLIYSTSSAVTVLHRGRRQEIRTRELTKNKDGTYTCRKSTHPHLEIPVIVLAEKSFKNHAFTAGEIVRSIAPTGGDAREGDVELEVHSDPLRNNDDGSMHEFTAAIILPNRRNALHIVSVSHATVRRRDVELTGFTLWAESGSTWTLLSRDAVFPDHPERVERRDSEDPLSADELAEYRKYAAKARELDPYGAMFADDAEKSNASLRDMFLAIDCAVFAVHPKAHTLPLEIHPVVTLARQLLHSGDPKFAGDSAQTVLKFIAGIDEVRPGVVEANEVRLGLPCFMWNPVSREHMALPAWGVKLIHGSSVGGASGAAITLSYRLGPDKFVARLFGYNLGLFEWDGEEDQLRVVSLEHALERMKDAGMGTLETHDVSHTIVYRHATASH